MSGDHSTKQGIGSAMLKPKEVAELLGVRLSTIYSWTHTGFIPHVKVGRLLRFRMDEITTWISKRSCTGRTTRRY